MDFEKIFDEYKNIAVYGMSSNSSKAAHTVPLYIKKQGYNVIPVNPKYDEIAGIKAYSELSGIPERIDVLNVFRPSEEAVEIVEQAIKRNKEKGDIKLIWFQLGIANEEAKNLAEEHGFEYIEDRCIYVEHNKVN